MVSPSPSCYGYRLLGSEQARKNLGYNETVKRDAIFVISEANKFVPLEKLDKITNDRITC